MKSLVKTILIAGVVLAAACSKEESAEIPAALVMAPDATGHYCGMLLAEHSGPKGQILLASNAAPVWFTSVRDTFTFLALPEEPKDVAAVYVSDMGKAPSWDKPGDANWVLAERAVYVIDSDREGGMGGAEAVPFGDEAAAKSFVAQHGGKIVGLEDAKAVMAETPLN